VSVGPSGAFTRSCSLNTEWSPVSDDNPSDEEFFETLQAVREERERWRREDECEPDLKPFAVRWDTITLDEVDKFDLVLGSAQDEAPIQRFLQEHPGFVVQPLRGGHGRWAVPLLRLGAEFVPDFVLAENSSIGFEWTLVELESPRARFFNRRGDPTQTVVHGIRQVSDWRAWLVNNVDYARRPRHQNGLGLVDIRPDCAGWVILGRERDLTTEDRKHRAAFQPPPGMHVRTYDWLARVARRTAERAERREIEMRSVAEAAQQTSGDGRDGSTTVGPTA